MVSPPLVVMGASTGGVEALRSVCAGLPAAFGAAVLVVLHVDAHASILPDILSHHAVLPVAHAFDGEPIEAGRIYVAPPDYHMLVEGSTIVLDRGPKEHHTRPALDPLFRSAAEQAGARVIAVVLTGDLNDGTAGVHYVKRAGGTAIVQDPDEAVAPAMPLGALRHGRVDHRLPLADIPVFLSRWAAEQGLPALASGRGHAMAKLPPRPDVDPHSTDRTPFVCPSCKGSLLRREDGGLQEFRCYVGHRFTLETLAHAQGQSTDEALWSSYRALTEKAMLLHLLAEDARGLGDGERAAMYADNAREAEHLAVIAQELTRRAAGTLAEPDPER